MALTRPATAQDLDQIVAVHQEAFPRFFMTELGPRFLRLYYAHCLQYEHGLLLVAPEDGPICGFVAGFAAPNGFYASLKRSKLRLGLAIFPALIRRPSRVRRLIANFRRSGEAAKEDLSTAAELASIGVAPSAAGQGIGQALVQAFLEAARQVGAAYCYLTTDRDGNDRTNRFYQRLGFSLHRQFQTSLGREMNEYRYDLSRDGANSP